MVYYQLAPTLTVRLQMQDLTMTDQKIAGLDIDGPRKVN